MGATIQTLARVCGHMHTFISLFQCLYTRMSSYCVRCSRKLIYIYIYLWFACAPQTTYLGFVVCIIDGACVAHKQLFAQTLESTPEGLPVVTDLRLQQDGFTERFSRNNPSSGFGEGIKERSFEFALLDGFTPWAFICARNVTLCTLTHTHIVAEGETVETADTST